jgi:competence protein ComEC
MVSIIFKNVGHGDTIIVEWQSDSGENEIGIIDCHQKERKSNAVIDHLRRNGYKKIRFMILSHPHTDHFSGFPSLLEFCKKNYITIERFWHTAAYDPTFISELLDRKITRDDFINSFISERRDRRILKSLFEEIRRLHGSDFLKKAGFVNDTSYLPLNKRLRLEFLAPSGYDELKKYLNKSFLIASEEELKLKRKENNPAGNLLSAVIMIKTDKWHVLLTSDAVSSTIERLAKEDHDRLNNHLAAVQVPHHGSKDSHYEEFWQIIPNKKEVPAFVSAGGKYGLPAKEIVEFFDKNYKEIHSTNFVGGFRDYFEIRQGKSPEIEQRHLNYPFFVYDQHFIDSSNAGNNYPKEFECGEKQVKIAENGSFTIETKSAYT